MIPDVASFGKNPSLVRRDHWCRRFPREVCSSSGFTLWPLLDMPPAAWILKLILNGDVRRYQCGGDPMCTTLEQLRVAAGYLFDLVETEQAALIFMYRDEGGDFCTLCDATLGDALCRYDGSVSLRLFIAIGTLFDDCVPAVQEVARKGSTYLLPPRPSSARSWSTPKQARSWTRDR